VVKKPRIRQLENWLAVRPVVIKFADEEFVIKYDEIFGDGKISPAVAFVHCYLNYGENSAIIGSSEH